MKPFKSPEVRVVEASAGSGKTYALAKRYVQLLLASKTPVAHRSVLAITFTNKAAGEMKARIIDLLKRIALGQLPAAQAQDILKPLGLDAAAARPLAAGLMEDIIRHYHFFQVQTIDSFMNTLLAGCAFKINLSARFKIKRNAVDYLQLSLDELIDEAQTRPPVKALFEAFIRQYLFLENRSGWFPKKDLLAVLCTLFRQYTTYQMPLLTFPGDGGVVEQKKKFLKIVREIEDIMPPDTNKTFAQALQKFILEHPAGFDIDQVSDSFARPDFPVNKEGEISGELEDLWDEARELLSGICLQEAYAVFNPYVDLFEATMAHLGRLQTKEDILFLQQLNQKTGELFDDGLVTVEELYYRLATRFHHYLIDEFQDTSAAQWRNLRMMVEEALSTGGTLFYVGDKKQAIFSFRGGESGLFDRLQREFTSFNVTPETLSKNYRSHKTIVEFNNHIFNPAHLRAFMLQQQERLKNKDIVFTDEDWQRLNDVFGSSRQTPREDLAHGAVRVAIVPGKKKQERLEIIREKVLAMVRDARTRFAWSDIAVLTRDNAQVQMVTQWLIHEGIYARSERTSDVKNHPLIRELAAFLRFLHSPVDNAAFAEFVLGGLFPKASGLSPEQARDFLFSCRRQRSSRGETYFYKQFREAYPEVWREYFEGFFDQVGVYPLYELAVSICGRLRCVELFPDAQGFVMHFLELIKRREEDSCDLETFLEYFEALEDEDRFVPMPWQDAVQVLTVHKAKGLEFPVVIIPFLEMAVKVGAAEKDGGQSFIWDVQEEGMRLLRLKSSYAKFSSELCKRYAREYKQAFFAEFNNVYVALTRAICEMHILIPERTGININPLPMLIPPELFSMGEFNGRCAVKSAQPPRKFLPDVQYKQWISHLQEEFLSESPAQAAARLEGEIVHFCLSKLGNLSKTDPKQAIEAAVAAAASRFPLKEDRNIYVKKLQTLTTQPSWKQFFYLPDAVEVLCEQEVVNRFGDTRRMDRLLVSASSVQVVDFKTSRLEAERHQQQIDEYKTLLNALYPGRKVEGFVLYE